MKMLITLILLVGFLAIQNNSFSGVFLPEGVVPDLIDPDYGYDGYEQSSTVAKNLFSLIRFGAMVGITDLEITNIIKTRLMSQDIMFSDEVYELMAMKVKEDAIEANEGVIADLDTDEQKTTYYRRLFFDFLGERPHHEFEILDEVKLGEIADLIFSIESC